MRTTSDACCLYSFHLRCSTSSERSTETFSKRCRADWGAIRTRFLCLRERSGAWTQEGIRSAAVSPTRAKATPISGAQATRLIWRRSGKSSSRIRLRMRLWIFSREGSRPRRIGLNTCLKTTMTTLRKENLRTGSMYISTRSSVRPSQAPLCSGRSQEMSMFRRNR